MPTAACQSKSIRNHKRSILFHEFNAVFVLTFLHWLAVYARPSTFQSQHVEMRSNRCPILKLYTRPLQMTQTCKGTYSPIHINYSVALCSCTHELFITNRTLQDVSKPIGPTCHAATVADCQSRWTTQTSTATPMSHGGFGPDLNESLQEHAAYQCLGCKKTWSSLFALGQHTGSPFMRGTKCGILDNVAELRNVPQRNLATGLTQAVPLYHKGTQGGPGRVINLINHCQIIHHNNI